MADMEKFRPVFEAWISGPPFERDVRRHPNNPKRSAWPGQYRDIDVELAWLAFEQGATDGVETNDGGQPK